MSKTTHNNAAIRRSMRSSQKIPKLRNAAECQDWLNRNQHRTKRAHRFEIWYAYLHTVRYGSSINKARPVLVISPDNVMEKTQTVTVLPLTSNESRGSLPFNEVVKNIGENGKISTILCDQIVTIDRHQLNDKIDKITDKETQKKIEATLMECLGIQQPA